MSILNIPAAQSNGWRVQYMRGDGGYHQLSQDGVGVWMTESPEEINDAFDLTDGMSGSVLVAGLGLGIAVQMIAALPDVESITVVEKSLEVVNLVAPYVEDLGKARYICADIEDYLSIEPGPFDWAYYDTWRNRGETATPERLIGLSAGIVAQDRIRCWPGAGEL